MRAYSANAHSRLQAGRYAARATLAPGPRSPRRTRHLPVRSTNLARQIGHLDVLPRARCARGATSARPDYTGRGITSQTLSCHVMSIQVPDIESFARAHPDTQFVDVLLADLLSTPRGKRL